MLVNFDSKIIFIHIPKTAGSTICSVLNWHGIGGMSNCHTSIDQIKQNMDTEGFKFVTFVRDPYIRFKSLYNFLLLQGTMHDTPMTFATNIFTGKYGWSFTNPMSYFCRSSDLWEIGRVENFNQDFERIFSKTATNIIKINKTNRPDIYHQFPQLRQMVARLYVEDFAEFKYPMENFVYKQVPCDWSIEDLEKTDNKYVTDEYQKTGSIFDKVPLSKMIP
jgi:Sulfotransferase family